jgi:Glycosyl transferase family 2
MSTLPLVTVGMPIFNGERYAGQAIESILGQTYRTLELVVSDNASSDRTEDIVRAYAGRDVRVRYVRSSVNRGGVWNRNRLIEMASGKYFMWADHDDLRHPEYVARAVEVLEERPDVVLCYSATRDIDESGQPLGREELRLRVDSLDPCARFVDVVALEHLCEPCFGLMRTAVLKQIGGIGNYADSDRVLLAQLCLRGRFTRLTDELFFRRAHALQSTSLYPSRQLRTAGWCDPARSGAVTLPHVREWTDFVRGVAQAPIPWSARTRCWAGMLRWSIRYRQRLSGDFREAALILARRWVGARDRHDAPSSAR